MSARISFQNYKEFHFRKRDNLHLYFAPSCGHWLLSSVLHHFYQSDAYHNQHPRIQQQQNKKDPMNSFFMFTARKRSLRRLCFHRCLSVHRGSLSRGESLSRWGEGVCPGGSLCPGGISVQGGGLYLVKRGRHASYWDAFLLCCVIKPKSHKISFKKSRDILLNNIITIIPNLFFPRRHFP